MAPCETAVSETYIYIFASSAGYFNIITLVYMIMNVAFAGDRVTFTTRSTWMAQRAWNA